MYQNILKSAPEGAVLAHAYPVATLIHYTLYVVFSFNPECTLDPFLRQICDEHDHLLKLAYCSLANFGEFYQHLCQVCSSSIKLCFHILATVGDLLPI